MIWYLIITAILLLLFIWITTKVKKHTNKPPPTYTINNKGRKWMHVN